MVPPSSNPRRNLLQRHRGKLIFSIAGIATLFTTGSIALYLLKRWLYKQQLKITRAHFLREQMKRRFNQTQEDSLHTVYELLPVVEMVLDQNGLQLDSIIYDIKNVKKNVKGGSEVEPTNKELKFLSKAELWNQLTLKSIIKLVTISYMTSSLFLLTRLQLNILTREYLEDTIKISAENEIIPKENDTSCSVTGWISNAWSVWTGQRSSESTTVKQNDDTELLQHDKTQVAYINEQAFLSLSWWLLNKGWFNYEQTIETIIREEFSNLKPKDEITLIEFSSKLTNVFQKINRIILSTDGSNLNLKAVLLPDITMEQFLLQQTLPSKSLVVLKDNKELFHKLVGETKKCLGTSASLIVFETLINECFQYIMADVESSVIKKKKRKPTTPDAPAASAEALQNNEGEEEEKQKDMLSEDTFQVAAYAISCKDCSNVMVKKPERNEENKFLTRLDSLNVLDDLSAGVFSNLSM
ncbi:Pex3p NDAI_0C04430 [Naumovozyma dairenensis CBS 421]|uniref:Peroxin-3 n=1 Tax=Naumovozyma dairenensis (strain ATCC 10597 / BCRC 20456 / CBS 421 / NBRC 0211 / NRRL Y-12639) TaxID=1071378 RepID=G0W8J2_NAUDC|nr:hypothetical protein NDAI_0C04430 [Naumovozyma dairenensis CBS 421]CCD24103.1 hypothetical protein NDAI_0C04430 [Naumovozyma dairenensis CBS 421]